MLSQTEETECKVTYRLGPHSVSGGSLASGSTDTSPGHHCLDTKLPSPLPRPELPPESSHLLLRPTAHPSQLTHGPQNITTSRGPGQDSAPSTPAPRGHHAWPQPPKLLRGLPGSPVLSWPLQAPGTGPGM